MVPQGSIVSFMLLWGELLQKIDDRQAYNAPTHCRLVKRLFSTEAFTKDAGVHMVKTVLNNINH